MSDQVAELQGLLGDRYIVDRPIGQGGMATVYLARDSKHDRQVAVKLLKPEIGALIGAGRFLHEIKLTSRLQHPHILPLYDSGEANNRIYYVMPFVSGESLRERLRREKRLPVETALAIAQEVADVLGYAHSHGIVHRDIKPENILISEGHAIVADFGIARAISKSGGERWETLTTSGVVVGTPAYMSPEQAAGELQIDGRSDLYSLGCVIYEMLVGSPPFMGPDGELKLVRRFTEKAPSVRASRSAVSERVDLAVAKALELDPADRFATAQDLMAALSGPGIARRSSGSRAAIRIPGFRVLAPYTVAVVAAAVALSLVMQRGDRAGARSGAAEPVDTTRGVMMPDTLRIRSQARSPAVVETVSTPDRRISSTPPPVATRRADTVVPRAVSIPRRVLSDALASRSRAAGAGATPLELRDGDRSMDSAQALARRGRLEEAMSHMTRATSSWRAAEGIAQQRVAAIDAARPQPAAPTVTPTQPVTPPVAAPTQPVVEDARPALAGVIRDYARAITSRDVSAIRRVYPGLTASQQQAWEQFFRSTESVLANLSIVSVEQAGPNATVSVSGLLDYVLRGSAQ